MKYLINSFYQRDDWKRLRYRTLEKYGHKCMNCKKIHRRMAFINEILKERRRQLEKWGDNTWPMGFGHPKYKSISDEIRRQCDEAFECGDGTYRHILAEEYFEVLAESDTENLKVELIQLAAVCCQIYEAIDVQEK